MIEDVLWRIVKMRLRARQRQVPLWRPESERRKIVDEMRLIVKAVRERNRQQARRRLQQEIAHHFLQSAQPPNLDRRLRGSGLDPAL
jgi:DNA-binding GntR family transcriptional regulator